MFEIDRVNIHGQKRPWKLEKKRNFFYLGQNYNNVSSVKKQSTVIVGLSSKITRKPIKKINFVFGKILANFYNFSLILWQF